MGESRILADIANYLSDRGTFEHAATTTLLIWGGQLQEEISLLRFAATVDALPANRARFVWLAQILKSVLNPIEEELQSRLH